MRFIIVTSFIIPLLILSCGRMSEDELFHLAQTAVEQQNYLEATQHLEELVDRFPKGNHTEASLFLLGNIYNDNLQEHQKAIATYRRLQRLYPDGAKTPGAMFLIGFIYNNLLNQYDSARVAYEDFLRAFPDHDMASSAQFEIDNLGKSPDELFRTHLAEKEQAQEAGAKKQKSPAKKK